MKQAWAGVAVVCLGLLSLSLVGAVAGGVAEEAEPLRPSLTRPLEVGRGMRLTWGQIVVNRGVLPRRGPRVSEVFAAGVLEVPPESGLLVISPTVVYEAVGHGPDAAEIPRDVGMARRQQGIVELNRVVPDAGPPLRLEENGMIRVGGRPDALARLQGRAAGVVGLSPRRTVDLLIDENGGVDQQPIEGVRIVSTARRGAGQLRRLDLRLVRDGIEPRETPPVPVEAGGSGFMAWPVPPWLCSAELLDDRGERLAWADDLGVRLERSSPGVAWEGVVVLASAMFNLPEDRGLVRTLRLTVVDDWDWREFVFEDHGLRHRVSGLTAGPVLRAEVLPRP